LALNGPGVEKSKLLHSDRDIPVTWFSHKIGRTSIYEHIRSDIRQIYAFKGIQISYDWLKTASALGRPSFPFLRPYRQGG
jgi:hypothetical protein